MATPFVALGVMAVTAYNTVRDSTFGLAYVIIGLYLGLVFACCTWKLKKLLPDDPAVAPERRRIELAWWAILMLAVLLGFAWTVYQARDTRRQLVLAISQYYLVVMLFCCVTKFLHAAEAETKRRVRLAICAVFVALFTVLALLAAEQMQNLTLKLVVFGALELVGVALGLGLNFLLSLDDRGHVQPSRAGQPEMPLREISLVEQKQVCPVPAEPSVPWSRAGWYDDPVPTEHVELP